MYSFNERVLELLAKLDRVSATNFIKGVPDLLDYVINIGFDKIEATDRRHQRRMIKSDIAPDYTIEARAVRFTADTIKRVHSHTIQFMKDWYIGGVALGDLTRENLLDEAEKEKKAGTGHLVNAKIYEILAEPLLPGQKMSEHWTEEAARKAITEIRDQPSPNGP